MHVGHHRDPRPDERDGRDVLQLPARLGLDRHAVHPALDRDEAVFGVKKLE